MNALREVYNILYSVYGPQGWWPLVNSKTWVCEHSGVAPRNDDEVFEVAAGAILTQNTSWTNAERALIELKKTDNLSREKIRSLLTEKLAGLIKSAGYYNQKAKKLKLLANFNKEVTRDNLLGIWGVGPETADSILLYAYNQPYFIIDAYTLRIFRRLGVINEGCGYGEAQRLFHKSIKPGLFKEYHALLVEHAKRHCRTKPECESCPINNGCRNFKNR